MAISEKTRKALWWRSGSRCAIGGEALILDGTVPPTFCIVGEECHIISGKVNGPRADPSYPREKIDSYENLILLCSVHHKVIDDLWEQYSPEDLRRIKSDHERHVATLLQDLGALRVDLMSHTRPLDSEAGQQFELTVLPSTPGARAFRLPEPPTIPGFSPLDSLVLVAFGNHVIRQDSMSVPTQDVKSSLKQYRVSKNGFLDSLHVLVEAGLLARGSRHQRVPDTFVLSPQGFEIYLEEMVFGYSASFLDVASQIVVNKKRRSDEIDVAHPPVVLRHILELMHRQDLIDIAIDLRGIVHIRRVARKLRDIVKRVGA